MMTHAKAATMYRLIPDKKPASIVLNADQSSPTTVSVSNAWIMQDMGGLADYGRVNVENSKTKIYVLDAELNPSANNREIRAEDTITFDSVLYRVTSGGGNLVNNRTVWECIVQKEIQ